MKITCQNCWIALLVFNSGCTNSESPSANHQEIPVKTLLQAQVKRGRGSRKIENVLGGTLFADRIVEKGGQRVLSGHVFWENNAPKKTSLLLAYSDSATLSGNSSKLVLTGRPVIEFGVMRDTGTSDTARIIIFRDGDDLNYKREGYGTAELLKR